MGEAPLPVTPRLVACYFGSEAMARLARVLDYSARQQCSTWNIDVRAIMPTPAPAADGTPAYEHNQQKLDHWAQAVEESRDGDQLLLIDADTMVLRPLDAIWQLSFDVVITTRPTSCRLPFNAGVVFARVNTRTRHFFVRWTLENRRMLRDRLRHQEWRKHYGGINQAALGCVMHDESAKPADQRVQFLELPCREWNCEDSSWPSFDPSLTRIVHVKSALREAALATGRTSPALRELLHIWRRLDKAARGSEVSP